MDGGPGLLNPPDLSFLFLVIRLDRRAPGWKFGVGVDFEARSLMIRSHACVWTAAAAAYWNFGRQSNREPVAKLEVSKTRLSVYLTITNCVHALNNHNLQQGT